jgi:tRNA dimethylallyltransferase
MKLPPDMLRQCWFLAGPTAAGKSELALALAEEIGAEILCLDSMTIYRELDIGTAKPTAAEQARVPHHLLNLVDPHEEFSTAQYLQAAERAIRDVLQRGRIPLFVGGTGLYLRSLLRGVFEGPPANWQFRQQLEAQAAERGPHALHDLLAKVDPVTAAQLPPQDLRRVIRALEIYHLTGSPPSRLRQEHPLPLHERPRQVFWLQPPRDWLHERINARVKAMLAAGWLHEVEQLRDRQPPLGRTAGQALGYRELLDFLAGRIASLEQARELIQTRTRQFAKRQETWFRNLEECHPLPIPASVREIVRRIVSNETHSEP